MKKTPKIYKSPLETPDKSKKMKKIEGGNEMEEKEKKMVNQERREDREQEETMKKKRHGRRNGLLSAFQPTPWQITILPFSLTHTIPSLNPF